MRQMIDMDDFEIVTVAAAHTILGPLVAATLLADGFQEVDNLKWVRSADQPVRQVLCFLQGKGGVLAPSWGVSLDFVPHVSGSTVKWHRTAKSAMLDLRLDPYDRALEMSYYHGIKPIAARAPQVVPLAIAQARQFWNRCQRTDDLLDAVQWLKQYYAPAGGLGFYNFVQHPLALAFVYARAGRTADAMAELDQYVLASDDTIKEDLRRRILSTRM